MDQATTSGGGAGSLAGPSIAIIGAGISGLCLAIQLKKAGIHSFTILEKSDGVGGTWRDNSYPGAACDVPAMFYSFSFEVNTEWSRVFAEQHEILEYLERCTDKYRVRPHIRFGRTVDSACFDKVKGAWRIRTTAGEEFVSQVLVSGVGQLNRPYTPDLPGLDMFAGTTFHSARWRHDHDLSGENVAMIGNGASAIQIVPEIAPKTKRLSIFQRSPNWMIPRMDRPYSEKERAAFQRYPVLPRLLRALIWARLEARWPAFSKDTRMGRRLERFCLKEMAVQIPDPALRAVLTPDYPVGCKRILISDDYYPAVCRDDVEIVTSHIREVTRDAVVTEDGQRRPVDTVILATGFRATEFLQPMEIRGRDGRSLNESWRNGAEAYLGMAFPGFPNFFMLYGPNTNLGHNSIILMIECQVRYVMQCLDRVTGGHGRTLDVREEAMRRWSEECQTSLRQSVWSTGCESWYKTKDGKITNNWPYSTIAFWRRTRRPDFRDFALETSRSPGGKSGEAHQQTSGKWPSADRQFGAKRTV